MDNPASQAWQRAMIFLATHPKIKNWVQGNQKAKGLARRFVGGKDSGAAVVTAQALSGNRISSSFFFLGEYVQDPSVVTQTIKELEAAIAKIRDAGLDLHVSIDPTQAGLIQSKALCLSHMERLARTIRARAGRSGTHVLMIDMEDSGVTRDTLDIFTALRQNRLPVGITLQAALYRTPADLDHALAFGCPVRLVKGAFAEKADIAFRPGKETDRAFLGLAGTLLAPASLEKGNYPVFATHDLTLIRQIIDLAEKQSIPKSAFEFEMLYGVRPQLQATLACQGFGVRVYLPYGRDFWPYSVRRIGENPKNIRFLIRTLGNP